MNAKAISVLNDLIEINNYRVAGFEKAMADLKPQYVDLKALFQKYSTQSRQFSQELTTIVADCGAVVETGNGISSSLHHAWIDITSLLGSRDRARILSEVELGEDAIKIAYKMALENRKLNGTALETVSMQASAIESAHDAIKSFREAAEAMS